MELGFAHATCADLRPQDTSAWLAEVLIGLPHASSQHGLGTRLENGARRTAAPIPVRHRHRQLPDWAEGGDVDGRAELLGAQKDSKAPATQGGWRHLVRVRVRGGVAGVGVGVCSGLAGRAGGGTSTKYRAPLIKVTAGVALRNGLAGAPSRWRRLVTFLRGSAVAGWSVGKPSRSQSEKGTLALHSK